MTEQRLLIEEKNRQADSCSHRTRMEDLMQVGVGCERFSRVRKRVAHKIVGIEWVKHQVGNNVMDSISF